MKLLPLISVFFIVLVSCNLQKAPEQPQEKGSEVRVVKELHPNGRVKSTTEALGKLRHGISKEFRPDGTLKNEITYVRNRKHGEAKSYYTDGKTVKNNISYENGYRHGMAKWYYQSGKLYRETPYENNRINGTRLTYYESRKLQAELPYLNNQPGTGLKEYTQEGKPKNLKGVILIREEDRISLESSFTVILSISDGTKNVEFYKGKLTEGSYWNEDLTPIPTEKGIGRIHVHVSRGSFKMETMNLVARMKTSLGHTRILKKEYHLAVENKF